MNTDNRVKLTLRIQPETKSKIEYWYENDNCKTMNEFVEKAVVFYTDFLSSKRNALLPQSIASTIDGRLTLLEKNLSALSFNHAVTLDMLTSIIAEAFEFGREELQSKRASSVLNVRKTNGRISLEKKVMDKWGDE